MTDNGSSRTRTSETMTTFSAMNNSIDQTSLLTLFLTMLPYRVIEDNESVERMENDTSMKQQQTTNTSY